MSLDRENITLITAVTVSLFWCFSVMIIGVMNTLASCLTATGFGSSSLDFSFAPMAWSAWVVISWSFTENLELYSSDDYAGRVQDAGR